ncbi:hypothetical protein [Glutamicibacter sp.]|jgi:hypothetical protein|uniref:hypothetical protein n=1 Tax=Glutamicibacter sp. TaxID=1931995 RepID=UPI002B48D58A|nr:hypothetical protein [Glutamicibacter sp.]HJX80001.1 hypothetical protein [Glutamicibacter sp.]
MSDSDFSLLVELVGLLREADERPGIKATVEIKGSGHAKFKTYIVEARVEESSYRTVRNDDWSKFEIVYQADTHQTLIIEANDSPIIRDGEWRIPVATPELAMFRPLDLPIWGGPTDTHKIISVARGNENEFNLEITMIGPDGDSDGTYEVVVDSQLCYVTRMTWNYKNYTVKNLEIVRKSDTLLIEM